MSCARAAAGRLTSTAVIVFLSAGLSGCGGTVVFDEPGEGGGSGEGGARSSNVSSARASTAVGPQNTATGSDGCPDVAPNPCDGGSTCYGDAARCDDEVDCDDGTDEIECGSGCRDDEFTCVSDGTCIPFGWACDGELDCPAGDDEVPDLCGSGECAEGEVACPGGLCIDEGWICDNVVDCSGGEDEADDVCNGVVCGESGIFSEEPVLTYCMNRNCCPEIDACAAAGIDDCLACLNAGSGDICDPVFSCLADNCFD